MLKTKKCLDHFLEWMAVICFAGLIFVVLLQVYARLFLPRSPHWTEEASRFLMIYMIAFAAGPAGRQRAYVNVDLFINYIKGRPRAALQLLIDLSVAALMAATAWYAWRNASVAAMMRQTSASLGIPMYIMFGSIVLYATSVLFYTLLLVLEDIKSIVKGDTDYGSVTLS